MLATLLLIIFINYISLGLPDSVLGVAWPSIYQELNLPLSLAGYIAAVVSIGTIISSLCSARLINRFGTGVVAAVSTLLTALAMFGFVFVHHPAFFFLLALPLGLGAGCIDTALNNFVALHYDASKMSFLHCFYGLGVAASPFIMSLALGNSGDWRKGYFVVSIIQFSIAALAFISLPLWKRISKKEGFMEEPPKTLTLKQLIKTPKVVYGALAFFTSCAIELTAGAWSSSYFVNTKGLAEDKAALVTMLFYVGLASGRFLSGVFANKLGRRRILRLSLYLLPVALLLFALPLGVWLSASALFLIGLGIGPIYPNLSHLTPKLFGKDISQSVMAFEQTACYIGILIMPSLFGILAQSVSTAILPYFLLFNFLFYAWTLLALLHKPKKKSNE